MRRCITAGANKDDNSTNMGSLEMAPGALERGDLPLQHQYKDVHLGSAGSKVIKPTVPQKKMDHGRCRSRPYERTIERMKVRYTPSATPVQPQHEVYMGTTSGPYWGAIRPVDLQKKFKSKSKLKCRSNMRTRGPWPVRITVKMRLQPTRPYRTINL